MKKRNLVALLLCFGSLACSAPPKRGSPPTLEALATEADPARWGARYESQFVSWQDDDEREAEDKLAADPRLAKLYAGSGYELSLKGSRDHLHSLEDVRSSGRIQPATRATCLSCKSASYPALVGAPPTDASAEAAFSARSFADAQSEATAPVACLDCHDPLAMDGTRKLRVSRPAFLRVKPDAATAKEDELRTLVCAQCHSEYYLREQTLPDGSTAAIAEHAFKQGTRIEELSAFLDSVNHTDFVHPVSGAPLLKLQHPQYELWTQGPHGASQVACTYCHMPESESGRSHNVSSALANIETTCARCHKKRDAATARADIDAIQSDIGARLSALKDKLIKAHDGVGALRTRVGNTTAVVDAQRVLRATQARWDFIESEGSRGFHAPAESARVLDDAARRLDALQLMLKEEGVIP